MIIVSDHQVRHIHVSALAQCALLACMAGLILWASYSTGRYMAIKNPLPAAEVADTADSKPEKSMFGSLFSKKGGIASMDKDELIERVASLEKQVTELETDKAHIIERVRHKTAGQINNLESIIQQTGLNPKDLRKQYGKRPGKDTGKQANLSTASGAGGPYISPRTSKNQPEQVLYKHLDELAMLRDIAGAMPISSPMKNSSIHSYFGRRIDPFNGNLAFHSGVDLAGPAGSSIRTAANGTVIAVKNNRSYGTYIDVAHGYDITTRYAHLSKSLVTVGQKVKQGEAIGVQGSTGRSTGTHLHYEVRYRGTALNPIKFLAAGNYVLEQ